MTPVCFQRRNGKVLDPDGRVGGEEPGELGEAGCGRQKSESETRIRTYCIKN